MSKEGKIIIVYSEIFLLISMSFAIAFILNTSFVSAGDPSATSAGPTGVTRIVEESVKKTLSKPLPKFINSDKQT